MLDITFAHWIDGAFYWQTLIFIVIGYLIGSVNFGHIFSRTNKTDLGSMGSKNYGATNAGRNYGIKGFLFVFLGDFLKVWVTAAILITFNLTNVMPEGSVAFGMFFVLIGHSYPLYFKFKGGKGVASYIAASFVISWIAGFVSLFFFILMLFISRRVSIASISYGVMNAIMVTILAETTNDLVLHLKLVYDFETIIVVWLGALFLLYKHKSNLIKIYYMEESYVRRIDNLNYSFREKVSRFARNFNKGIYAYYENLASNTKELLKGESISDNPDISFSPLSWNEEDIIKPYSRKNKIIVSSKTFNLTPKTNVEVIMSINSVHNLKKNNTEMLHLFQIEEKNDLKTLLKVASKFEIISEVSKGRYFAEKAYKNGSNILQINPIKTSDDDLKSIVKLSFNKNIPLILSFNYSQMSVKFIDRGEEEISDEYRVRMFLKSIASYTNLIQDYGYPLTNIILSIDYCELLDNSKLFKNLAILYKNPLIIQINKNKINNLNSLLDEVENLRVINFVNIK